jgi:hypothetical protein
MEWTNNKLVKARILSVTDRNCVMKAVYQNYCIRDSWGNEVDYHMEDNKLIFHMLKDRIYLVTVD